MAEIKKIERQGNKLEQYYVGELVYDNSADPIHGFDGPTFFDPTSEDGFTLDDVKRLRAAAYPNGEPEKVDFYFAGFLESMMDHRSPRDECYPSGRATSEEIDQALETSEDALQFARQLTKSDLYSVYRIGIVIRPPRTPKT